MDYELIYSNRKSIGLGVKRGVLTVRAPFGVKQKIIKEFIKKHEYWINSHIQKSIEKEARFKDLTEEKIRNLNKEAKEYFNIKTREYAEIMNLNYGRITITSASTRFGSCSQKGNICFSYRLMLYPEAAREYVIVHELSHLVYMNHSKDFYNLLSKYMPDYKERKRLLK